MVFDFATRDRLFDALVDPSKFWGEALWGPNPTDNNKIENTGLIGFWSNAAVTLVNNHDMQVGHQSLGSVDDTKHPLKKVFPVGITTMAAYAFILTHPGIPSVFVDDWNFSSGTGTTISNLILLRRNNNVIRSSHVRNAVASNGTNNGGSDGIYASFIGTPNNEQLAIKIGQYGTPSYTNWKPESPGNNVTKSSSLVAGQYYEFERHDLNGHAFTVYTKNPAFTLKF